jgi:cytochrome P450
VETTNTEVPAPNTEVPAPEVDCNAAQTDLGFDRPAYWSAVREICPVVHTPRHGGHYVVTGHKEVMEALQDRRFSSAGAGTIPDYPMTWGMLNVDPPDATKFRRELNPYFSREAAEQDRDYIQQLVNERVDRFIESGSADLVNDLTGPVAAQVTMYKLGIPVERSDHYAAVLLKAHADLEAFIESGDAVEMNALLNEVSEVIDARWEKREDDWISALIDIPVGTEKATKDWVLRNTHLIMEGGVDTTTQFTAWTLFYLGRDPELRERLRSDRTQLPAATEEFLRIISPLQGLPRVLLDDVELGGKTLRKGERAWLCLPGANRDPNAFPEPDKIDIDRKSHRNVAFGAGVHRCIGQFHARIQFEIMLNAVLDRLPDYVVDVDQVVPFRGGSIDGLLQLPVTFSPGPRRPLTV